MASTSISSCLIKTGGAYEREEICCLLCAGAFSDLDITVDGLTAHVEGFVRIDGADGLLTTKIRDARAFAAELENDDGEWKIVAVTLLKYSNT